jgi:lipoprotein-anchoring transpeptidase ErfK/SrfK
VARVFVTKEEGAVRGVDAAGTTVFWLPATVGSSDMPSPHGTLSVESVTRDPYYRWDPAVLKDVSRRAPVRMLPPGPNSLVGLVWVALSRPHVGIHGTPYPETVGYSASHGCVRLTNWDAVWFSRVARPGLAVVFQ